MWGRGQGEIKGSTFEVSLPLLSPSLPTVWPGSQVLTLKKPSDFLCLSFPSLGQRGRVGSGAPSRFVEVL